jgi:RNA polymerase sigma-70 factor (ECF subfamily)
MPACQVGFGELKCGRSLAYQAGVLESAPTGPSMVIMRGGGSAGRRPASGWASTGWNRTTGSVTLFPAPAEALAEGEPVGTYPASADGAADGTEAEPEASTGASTGADAGIEASTATGSGTAARQGDADELFRTAYPKLAGWIRRLVDDDDTAHEIASEAFVRLLSRWTKVESPQSYLYMIATNLVRDHWRKTERERRAMRSVGAVAEADIVTHPGQDVDVRNLIETLPGKLREPFLLHYYAGFPIREVAALLHRPEGTIKADLYAARAKLKTALGERDA